MCALLFHMYSAVVVDADDDEMKKRGGQRWLHGDDEADDDIFCATYKMLAIMLGGKFIICTYMKESLYRNGNDY